MQLLLVQSVDSGVEQTSGNKLAQRVSNGAAGTDRNYGRLLSFVHLCESEAELDSAADG